MFISQETSMQLTKLIHKDESGHSVALQYNLLRGTLNHILTIGSDRIISTQAAIWPSKSYRQPKG